MTEPEQERYGKPGMSEIREKRWPRLPRSAAQCAGAAAPTPAQFSMRAAVGVVPWSCFQPTPATPLASEMSTAEADRWAWLLVLSFVFGCNVLQDPPPVLLLPS